MTEIKTVALIGAGGIGTYLISNLQPVLGRENLRIIAGGSRKKRLEKEGVTANGVNYQLNVVEPGENTGFADLAILITKFTGLEQAVKDMKNQIGPDTTIMSPLNGVESEEIVAKTYGWDRTLYSLARVSVMREGANSTFNPNVALMEYGEKTNRVISERVQAVRELFDKAGIVSVIQEDMVRAIWHKYMCNVSENQCAAVLGISFGQMVSSRYANHIRESIAREVIAVARKKGIDLRESDLPPLIRRLKDITYTSKPSTLQDIEAGRKTEVEMFAGAMVRMGKETGVPTPLNEFLYAAIRVLEEKNEGLI